jgi:predicted dehydrogenase
MQSRLPLPIIGTRPWRLLRLQAGKHVYVEKPCSHNPAEGEMLIEAQEKYRKLVQMGTQQRSSPHTIEVVDKIRQGMIGRPYFAKSWYVNTRKSIGVGKEVPVPPQLDWDLWQGPAPRRPYRDNVHPYNWHWFKIYGTGETLNNGTHEVDVCRWALGVDYPKRITASGGRYQFKDDWQFYDTLVTSFEYDDALISWEGKSCQGMKYYDRDRGSIIMGTKATILVDRDGYEIYDLKGNKVGVVRAGTTTSSADLVGRDSMTDAHFANFIAGIRKGERLNSEVAVGNVAVTMLQLSNIAWEVNRELNLDTKNGQIKGDPEAMKCGGASTRRAGRRMFNSRLSLPSYTSFETLAHYANLSRRVRSLRIPGLGARSNNGAPLKRSTSIYRFVWVWPATPSVISLARN